MDVGLSGLRETLEEIFHQLDLEIADASCGDLGIHYAIGPSSEINRSGRESFVHGHQEKTGTQNAALGAESSLHGFAEGDADVLDRVMLVNIEVAAGAHVEIKRAVACNQLEHVVEETDSCGDARPSAPIQIEVQPAVGFVGLAMNLNSAWHDEFSLEPSLTPEPSMLFDLIS